MSEGLEPHHHIIRRAGSTLNKHLNLSDEALITRLIDRGCIGADDRGRYTGKTKRVKDRFIARFQNQSYELFLSFVECLREDEKYSQLVAVLDDALAEYGHVIPSDVTTTTRDASPTPIESVETTTQQDDNPLSKRVHSLCVIVI